MKKKKNNIITQQNVPCSIAKHIEHNRTIVLDYVRLCSIEVLFDYFSIFWYIG